MSYIGNNLQVAYPSYRVIDDISSGFNGVLKTFALRVAGSTPIPFPINPQQCLLSVNNIVQKPDSTGASGFTLTGSNIVFATAPTAGWSFFGTVLAGADYVNVGANFPAGTAAVPSVTFDESTGTGLFLASSNVLGIATSGVQQLTVDSSGRVGIGTSSPGYRLHLSSSGTTDIFIGSGSDDTRLYFTDTNRSIRGVSGGALTFQTSAAERIRIDGIGNVGIGTISPEAQLDVRNGSFYSGSPSVDTPKAFFGSGQSTLHGIRISGGPYSTASIAYLDLDNFTAKDLGWRAGFRLASGVGGGFSGNTEYLSISATSYSGSAINATERLRIDSSGRLLVGTTSALPLGSSLTTPAINIETLIGAGALNHNIGATRHGGTNPEAGPFISLARSRGTTLGAVTLVANGDTLGALEFCGADGTDFGTTAALIKCEVDGTPGANDMPGRLVFSTTADGAASPTERMRITSGGSVGIGTSAPAMQLHTTESALIGNNYVVNRYVGFFQDPGAYPEYILIGRNNSSDVFQMLGTFYGVRGSAGERNTYFNVCCSKTNFPSTFYDAGNRIGGGGFSLVYLTYAGNSWVAFASSAAVITGGLQLAFTGQAYHSYGDGFQWTHNDFVGGASIPASAVSSVTTIKSF